MNFRARAQHKKEIPIPQEERTEEARAIRFGLGHVIFLPVERWNKERQVSGPAER